MSIKVWRVWWQSNILITVNICYIDEHLGMKSMVTKQYPDYCKHLLYWWAFRYEEYGDKAISWLL